MDRLQAFRSEWADGLVPGTGRSQVHMLSPH
jgi:hypothetical protein